MAIHVYTSVAGNCIPNARVLAESVKRIHPEILSHFVLVDAVPIGFLIEQEPFDYIEGIYDLGIENPEQWLFKHSVVEACTGLKARRSPTFFP